MPIPAPLSLALALALALLAFLGLSAGSPHPLPAPFYLPSFKPSPFFNLIKRSSVLRPTGFTAYYQSLNHPTSLSNDSLGARPATDIQSNSLSSGGGSLEHAHHELFKVVPEPTPPHLALSLIPAFIVVFGCFSAFVKEKLYIGEAILAVAFGIILGPYVSGVFDPRSWNDGIGFDDTTLELTRVVIALSVFAVGVELPKAYILRHWRSLAYLLGPIMLVGWLVSGALIYAMIPGLNFLEALVVAAAVTPTDPILAASVVGKGKYAQKHVPAHLRHLLQAESGCNDGAAFPFLYLAMFLLLRDQSSVGRAISSWVLLVILYQILLGIVIGIVVGIAARKTLKFCKRRSMIDRESMVAMYVALALLTTGVTTLAGSDDLLAAFACGAAFAWDDWFTESIEASNFSGIVDLLINCGTFIYVGATIPFASWNDSTLTLVPWRLILLGILILFLRRLPAMLLLQWFIPDLKTHREAVFCGHFGPIGVGAIFISTLAASKLPTPSIPPQSSLDILALTVQPLIYLIVLFSILVHGLSIPFFNLGRNVHSRVHSMTRTWTQASGNEPSWLSRVKRVDRTTEEALPDLKAEEQPLAVTSPTSMLDSLSQVERANGRQISDDQPTCVEVEDVPVPDTFREELPTLFPTSPSSHLPSNDLQLVRSAGSSPHLNRVGLLRLGSAAKKKTLEEQEAHRRAKFLRDEWCRPERVDSTKKDEEWVYKSGRHIVIERGDGDEVEVRNIDPSSSEKPKAGGNPNSSSATITPERLESRLKRLENIEHTSAPPAAATKLHSARRIVHRGLLRKPKSREAAEALTRSPTLVKTPQELLSPRSTDLYSDKDVERGVSVEPHDLTLSEGPTGGQFGSVRTAGNQAVSENSDGKITRAEAPKSSEMETLQQAPQHPGRSDLAFTKSSFSLPNLNDSLSYDVMSFPRHSDEDEWEEDDAGGSTAAPNPHQNVPHHALSRSVRSRSSGRAARRPRLATSSQLHHSSGNGITFAESGEVSGSQSRPLRSVGFAADDLRRGQSRKPGLLGSRSSSPSRSIRFAEHPARPPATGLALSHRKSRRKRRRGLLSLVNPAKDHPQQSSIVADNAEQDLEKVALED